MVQSDTAVLAALCRYNAYANELVLAAAACLSDADFESETSPSRGSVGGLLRHMLASDVFFMAACREQPVQMDMARLKDRAGLAAYWVEVERDRLAFLAGCHEASLGRVLDATIAGRPARLAVWQLMLQALMHAAHHRGELSIVLTQLGHPLPTLDIIVQFMRESGQGWV